MKKLIGILLSLLLVLSLCSCGSQTQGPQLFEGAWQHGDAEPKTEGKGTEKGSLSNPYSLNETITITSYEVQGWNEFTGERTVANPATIELTVGDMVTSSVKIRHDDPITGEDITTDLSIFAPVTAKIISLTGDTIEFNDYIGSVCQLVTKDKREVGDWIVRPENYFGLQCIYEYGKSRTCYEGNEFTFLIGSDVFDMKVDSTEDLELLTFNYYDESGERVDVYVSLH